MPETSTVALRLEGLRRELKGLTGSVRDKRGIARSVALSLAMQAAMVETVRVVTERFSALLWGLHWKGVLTSTELEAARVAMLAEFAATTTRQAPADEFSAVLRELRKAARPRSTRRSR